MEQQPVNRGRTLTQGRFVTAVMRGQEVIFMLDTGAGYNFLSSSLWRRIFNEEEIKAPSRRVTAFDGSSVSIQGEVLAKFTLDEAEIETKFMLCNIDCDNILGMDFFLAFCDSINFIAGLLDLNGGGHHIQMHSTRYRSTQASSLMPDYSGYQQVISDLIKVHGDLIKDMMFAIGLYIKNVAYVNFERELPQRDELSATIRSMRNRLSMDECVAILLGVGEQIHQIILAENQVEPSLTMLNIEFRWLFNEFGWPYYRELPNPCSY